MNVNVAKFVNDTGISYADDCDCHQNLQTLSYWTKVEGFGVVFLLSAIPEHRAIFCKYIMSIDPTCAVDLLMNIDDDNVELARYIISLGVGLKIYCPMAYNAGIGHLQICKLLYEEGLYIDLPLVMSYAASGGHVEIIRFLHEQGVTITEDMERNDPLIACQISMGEWGEHRKERYIRTMNYIQEHGLFYRG